MGEHAMGFKMRIWLETPDGFRLGPGKADLLRRIDEYGSLNKAAKSLGMSYRKAWGRLKEAEKALGTPLVSKEGGNKAGYNLTPFASELIAWYEQWIDEVHRYAVKKSSENTPPNVSILKKNSH